MHRGGVDLERFSGSLAIMPVPVHSLTGAEAAAVELAEPEVHPRPRRSHGDAGNDWLCYWCLDRVASEEDRFTIEGQSEFTFKNPEGVRFNLVTFSRTPCCRSSGAPTLEHTWFPGHAWCYAVCDR